MRKRSADDTRIALIRAAETLFAARGFDAVSLREVSVAAGQLNNSAVGYHFGSREVLIDAILERHSTPIQARYEAQLDALERHGALTLRAAVEILVLPIVAKLDDPDGGWPYLSLCAQLSVSPHLPLVERPVARTPQVQRLMLAMLRFVQSPPELARFRLERTASAIYASLTQWYRMVAEGSAPVPREVFAQDLVDAIAAIICRPVSEETLQALAKTRKRSPARKLSPTPAPTRRLSPTRSKSRKS